MAVDVPTVTVLVAEAPAVVLGSTQPTPDGPGPQGWEVVRRRSGGGAVLVGPDDPLWVDVDLPAADPRWRDDVGESFLWLGRAWAAALGGGVVVHEGRFDPGRWGRAVCFAGRGPGEVFLGGAKVVGLAQRRTRDVARFQCAVPRRWDPEPLISCVVPPHDRARARRDLAAVAQGVDTASLLERFLDAIDA